MLKNISKDDTINTVWSCSIVDMETKSNNTLKSPNEMEKDDIIDESLFQLKQKLNIPDPYKITTSLGLHKKNDKWMSKNTGFTSKKLGYLPMKGNIENLFALGCFTDTKDKKPSNFSKAIESSIVYLNRYDSNIGKKYKWFK